MDSLLFILVLGCLFLVTGWYLGNTLRGANGERGLLAIRPARSEATTGDAASYRAKSRPSRSPRAAAEKQAEAREAAYQPKARARRFLEKDAPAYRPRGAPALLEPDPERGSEPSDEDGA